MNEDTPNRFGKFLLIIGSLLWIIFFATDRVRNPEFALFFWGAVCLGLGFLLVWRNRPPSPQSADRFRTARRVSKRLVNWRSRREEKADRKKNSTKIT